MFVLPFPETHAEIQPVQPVNAAEQGGIRPFRVMASGLRSRGGGTGRGYQGRIKRGKKVRPRNVQPLDLEVGQTLTGIGGIEILQRDAAAVFKTEHKAVALARKNGLIRGEPQHQTRVRHIAQCHPPSRFGTKNMQISHKAYLGKSTAEPRGLTVNRKNSNREKEGGRTAGRQFLTEPRHERGGRKETRKKRGRDRPARTEYGERKRKRKPEAPRPSLFSCRYAPACCQEIPGQGAFLPWRDSPRLHEKEHFLMPCPCLNITS